MGCSFDFGVLGLISSSKISGREQSMKPMIGKSIDKTMTVDAN